MRLHKLWFYPINANSAIIASSMQDVSDEHMRLLLEYMYRGSISVRQPDLTEILRTASSLKIRGLTTAEAPAAAAVPSDDDDAPLIVDEHINTDSFQQHDVQELLRVLLGSSDHLCFGALGQL